MQLSPGDSDIDRSRCWTLAVGFPIADWIMTPVPPGGSEVGLNSTVGPLFGPRSGNCNSLLPDQDSLFRSLGNSLKKRSDLAGFELIQRLDRPQKRGIPCIFP